MSDRTLRHCPVFGEQVIHAINKALLIHLVLADYATTSAASGEKTLVQPVDSGDHQFRDDATCGMSPKRHSNCLLSVSMVIGKVTQPLSDRPTIRFFFS